MRPNNSVTAFFHRNFMSGTSLECVIFVVSLLSLLYILPTVFKGLSTIYAPVLLLVQMLEAFIYRTMTDVIFPHSMLNGRMRKLVNDTNLEQLQ